MQGTLRMSCGGVPGYVSAGDDRRPRDAAINPGAKQVCNLEDDDCDGPVWAARPRRDRNTS